MLCFDTVAVWLSWYGMVWCSIHKKIAEVKKACGIMFPTDTRGDPTTKKTQKKGHDFEELCIGSVWDISDSREVKMGSPVIFLQAT